MSYNELVDKTIFGHEKIYGCKPSVISYAPGRIEVLGNHTDYNLGITLSAAINMGICFAISKSENNEIKVNALDFNESFTFNPEDSKKINNINWVNYIKGIFYYFYKLNVKSGGLNCSFSGSIPMGSGLSSSAALEVATCFAIQEYCKSSIGLKKIAEISQQAEQNFAGCKCGLLDQYSSIYGIKNALIYSDFRTHKINSVNISKTAIFLMINSNITHELSESPYNERREKCYQAVKELDKLFDKKINSLRDITYEEFKKNKNQLHNLAARRAEHVVGEIDRVKKGLDCIKNNRLIDFGSLLFESHESSIENFENSCKELNIIVDCAKKEGALGARLSGGGWGGSVVALTTVDKANKLSNKILENCKNKGLNPSISQIIPSEGARILKGYK